jgi:WD40 repeat protein
MSTPADGKPNYLALFLTSLILLGPIGFLAWYLVSRSLITPEADRGSVWQLLSRDVRPMDRLAWSPDGTALATCSRHGDVNLWKVENGTGRHQRYVLASLSLVDSPTGLAWSRDGTLLAFLADGQLAFWDVAADKAVRSGIAASPGQDLTWSADNSHVAYAAGSAVEVCDTKGAKTTFTGAHGGAVNGVEWQPGGSLIVTASEDGAWGLWDFTRTALARTTPSGDPSLVVARWDPAGKRIATGSRAGGIRVWTADGKPDTALGEKDGLAAVTALCWAPEGGRLVSAHEDKTVLLWEVKTGKRIATYKGFNSYSLAWQPGTERVVVGGDGQVWLWDLER